MEPAEPLNSNKVSLDSEKMHSFTETRVSQPWHFNTQGQKNRCCVSSPVHDRLLSSMLVSTHPQQYPIPSCDNKNVYKYCQKFPVGKTTQTENHCSKQINETENYSLLNSDSKEHKGMTGELIQKNYPKNNQMKLGRTLFFKNILLISIVCILGRNKVRLRSQVMHRLIK